MCQSSANTCRRGLLILGALTIIALGLAALPFAPSAWVAAAIIFPVGVVAGLINVVVITHIQAATEPRMLGRVMSLIMFNAVGLTPLSYALAGALVDAGITRMFLGAAALVLLLLVRSGLSRPLREFY